jgi:type VI secretion system protein ImpJ
VTTHKLNPVAWAEGMFLRPHHMQQRELFSEERLRYHLRALNPFHWGVSTFELDEEALADHRFDVLRLDAVMPGGTIVRYPGNALVEPREFDPDTERTDVFVALRNLSPTEPNAAPADEGSRNVRYKVKTEELPDVARGGFDAPIELAYPNVRVFLSGEESDLEVHESFKLAEVVATGESKRPFALSQSYAPPLLALQGSNLLLEEVTKITSQIAGKVRVVAGRTQTLALADLPRFWMRYTLARMTGVLRHLLSTGHTIPFDMYTALVETAGALGSFRHIEALDLPVYDHEDLYKCFRALIRIIETELQAAVPERFHEFVLIWDAGKKYYSTGELTVQLVDPRNVYYLGVKAGLDAKELARWVVEEGKASSRPGLAPLVMLNTKGLRIEHLAGPPTEIAARTGFEYFKVDPHGPQWPKVKDDFSFALSLGKLENAEARLYVVVPE